MLPLFDGPLLPEIVVLWAKVCAQHTRAEFGFFFVSLHHRSLNKGWLIVYTKGVSRVIYKRSKRSHKITTLDEDDVIKLKTLKTRRMARASFISSLEEKSFEKLSLKN
ncbi:hypothetical protein M9H77_17507 [Catharanthus roseus]|uniref:Uncharacterized protein n=1 Tax=Catharanthus roseus TaxID=4058 RepID=A0ACC0B4S7_CATRO|nr:hypothetical protein M9H77_17507 [Catharanthus roseus]